VSEARRILLYALVAGLSPLALLSTLAVLGSGRGRVNGLVFGAGFVLAQATVLVVAVVVGSAAAPDRDWAHDDFASALELVLGLALLVLAWRGGRRRTPVESVGESRTGALLARLHGLRPSTAGSIGALLGVGGVKRLTITLLAGATIAVAGLAPAEDAALGVVYVAVAAALVWLPVGVYLVAGSRADELAARAQSWVVENQRRAALASTLLFGVLLTGDAVVRLL
jgi:hypothetical protein